MKALSDTNKSVRSSVAYALGSIKDIKAVEPLIKLLSDSKTVVRQDAADALIEFGKPALEELNKALKNEKDESVKQLIQQTIDKISKSDSPEKKESEK
ncbi:MAG: HEAT repeat domain-containing protein [Planctomycetota bacterium]